MNAALYGLAAVVALAVLGLEAGRGVATLLSV
jgi:hypothetical protein